MNDMIPRKFIEIKKPIMTERTINNNLHQHKDIVNIINTGTMLTPRNIDCSVKPNSNYDTGVGFDSCFNTFKWTMKTRDSDRAYNKTKQLDDFEKLFYQSVPYEKNKIVHQKGIDFYHIKNQKSHNALSNKTISKSKSSKHIKNK